MSLIDVVDMTFAYEGSYEEVFSHVSFQIDTDWKLGFVGRNGRGKTTFLQLLLGKYTYQGTISSHVEFGYFPYEIPDKSRMAYEVLTEISPQSEDWEIIRELNFLKVETEALYRSFSTLSFGEQTKMLLAALFLGENRFLLIDEPTNHLDRRSRQFLDRCIDHVLSINRNNIQVQKGNFSSWYANKET